MKLNNRQLPQPRQNKLRSLLDSDGFDVLVEVLSAKAFAVETEVANSAVVNTTGYDAKAKALADEAIKIHSAIRLLNDLKAQKSFETAIAEPSTPN